MKFSELKLRPQILKAVSELGFETPTEIQEKCIPLIQKGDDVIGQSMTGSGKTAAFGLPLLEKLQKKGTVQMTVIAPTRELAHQIVGEFRKYLKHHPLSVVAVYGGVSLDRQAHDLQHADVVVGTPGRMLDHMERGNMTLSRSNYVVLDEADRMFDMGFIEDIDRILSKCPRDKQTLLFSATFPEEIKKLITRYMRHPKTVKVKSVLDADVIKEIYYTVQQHEKFSVLVHVLKEEKPDKAMIFCATRRNAELVSNNLSNLKFDIQLIHGGLSQNKRNKVMKMFKEHKLHILVSTDVAARGLDIGDVTHILNYDIPSNIEDYIHRIGRTARAGKKGKAISIVAPRDHDAFRDIESYFRGKLERKFVKHLKRLGFSAGFQKGGRGRRGDTGGYGRGPRSGSGWGVRPKR